MGRPQKQSPLPPEKIELMASWGMTNREIAAAINMNESTFQTKYKHELRRGRSNMKERLRRIQLKVAAKGNPAMLIWLGKQYLQQADKQEQEMNQTIIIKEKEIDSAPRTDSD
jgi:hypothetical protein